MIRRPEAREAATYYFKYIDRVPVEADIVPFLERQAQELSTFFATISEEHSRYRYAADKWSLRQVLNHVTDTERVFAYRALWFARGFETPLPSFDQDVASKAAQADAVTWAAHAEDFRATRTATLTLFRNLPPDAWDRIGVASDAPVTVRALAFIVAGHAAHHHAILRERYF